MASVSRAAAGCESLLAEGVAWFRRGLYSQAIPSLSAALRRKPAAAQAWIFRAAARRMIGRPAAAWRDVRIALRLDPASSAGHLTAASVLKDLGRHQEALRECEFILGRGPGDALVYELKADLECCLGLKDLARRSLAAGLRLAPRSAALHEKSGAVLRDLGCLRLALSHCREALRLDPSLARAAVLRRDLEGFLGSGQDQRRRGRTYPGVTVDPRIELLSVVCLLAGRRGQVEGFEGGEPSIYEEAARRRFGPHKRHPAARELLRALDDGMTVGGAQRSMLSLGALPELSTSSTGPAARRPELLAALRDFCGRTGFMEFFASQEGFYERCRREVLSQIRSRDYAILMERYAGLQVTARYTVVLCPLKPLYAGGKLNHLDWNADAPGYHVTSTMGPAGFSAGLPRFEYWQLRWDVWHELGHTLLDGLLEEHLEALDRTESLFRAVPDRRYGWWGQSVREHIVQGLASRVMVWAAEKGLTSEPVLSFSHNESLPYLRAVMERLGEYERERRRYRTLRSFYPRLLAAFADLLKPGVSRPRALSAPSARALARRTRDGIF